MYIKSNHQDIIKSQYFSYIGNDAKEKFIKKILCIYNKISYETYKRKDDKPILNKKTRRRISKSNTLLYLRSKVFNDLQKEI